MVPISYWCNWQPKQWYQTTLWYPKVKSDNDCCRFSKDKKNMSFHCLLDHVSDYHIWKMLSIWKHNSTTLLKDQSLKPYVLGRIKKPMPFSNVQHLVLQNCFLNKVRFFVRHTITERINNGGCGSFFPFLVGLVNIKCYIGSNFFVL
jgi:hypothetical protein